MADHHTDEDGEPAPDLDELIEMAWRRAAFALRRGRVYAADRWLRVHARLIAMPRPAPGDPSPDPEDETAPRPTADPPARSGGERRRPVHPMHPTHPVSSRAPEIPARIPCGGPDPPPGARAQPESGP